MALKKAMAGDTTSLHKLGVGRGGAEYYKGVLINQESNSILTDTLWRKRLGLSINENYMKVLEAAASRQKLEKNYLYDETIKLNRNSNLVAQNLYGEKSQIEAYQFQNEKIKNSFWRFKGKYRENSSLKSYVENSDTVKKNIGIVQKDELSFDYNFQLQIKKNSNSLMKKFERTINHVVNLTQIVQESGPFYLEDYCQQENLLIRLKGKISEEAIAYMMRLSKDTHWLLLAKMLGISNSVGLSDNRIRRKAIRPLFKEDKVYKNIKKFEKHFLPTLESLKKSQSKQEMAKHLRNMFRDYNNDPFIYEYILYVNQNEQLDLFSPMAFRNIQTSIFIESPDCKLNWSGNTSESEVSFTK